MRCRNNAIRRLLLAALPLLLVCASQSAIAENPAGDPVLEKTSTQLDSYLYRISHVRCTEKVTQEKLAPNGHIDYVEHSTYDYFILFHSDDEDFQLQETRSQIKPPAKGKKNIPMLLTNGFSNLLLVFHPYYRQSFRFALDTPETINGMSYQRVRFTYVPGMRTPAALALRGREYPLHLDGTAWINPATGAVARIEARLADNMLDVGLRSLSARVDYAPVKLPGWADEYRFPVLAVVDLETPRQHWHNEHRFTDYKRFMVDMKISMPDEDTSQ